MPRYLLWFRIIVLSFILGLFLFQKQINTTNISDYWVEREVKIEGVLIRNPIEIEDKKYLAIKPIYQDQDNAKNLKDLILVSVPFYQDIHKGDKILLMGKLQANTYNPFDVFLNNKLVYTIYNGTIQIVEPSLHKDFLFMWRNSIIAKIKEMFLPRESFLASMILVGKSGGYNKDIDNMFRQAGLSHILVVSGLHLTMFTDILNYLVYMLPVGLIFVFSINLIFILFFILLIGFTGSLLRASIMILLHIIGKANHRVYNMTNALLLSSFVILLFNPQTLFVDLGFQLSFLSVLCLVYISPIITDVLTLYFPNEKWKSVIFALSVVLSIFIGMTPFLIYKTNSISLISPLANLIIVPLITPLLCLLVVGVCLNFVWGSLFWFVNIIISGYLKFILFLVSLFASVKYANYPIGGLSLIVMCIYYLILIVFLIKYYKKHLYLTFSF